MASTAALCLVRVGFALVAVVLESVGALLGAVNKARVLVADLAAKVDQQIFAGRRPGRRNE